MKKLTLLMAMIMLFTLTGCTYNKKFPEDAKKFKEEYESFNGKENDYFKYRELNIEEDNLMVYTTAEEVVRKMDNRETFLVYFGDPECPWCRSVIEAFINTAIKNDVLRVYYVRIWDGFHNEILRDTYNLNDDGEVTLVKDGTSAYKKLLKKFDNVLDEYTLTDKDGNIVNVGEKRIFAPNFVYIKDGDAVKVVSGISDKQDNYNAELTDDIIKDEEEIFKKFLTKPFACDGKC